MKEKPFRLVVPIPNADWETWMVRLPNFKEMYTDGAIKYAVYTCTDWRFLNKLVGIVCEQHVQRGYMYPKDLKPYIQMEYIGPHAREYR